MSQKNKEAMIAFIACAGHAAGKSRFAEAAVESCAVAVDAGFRRGECRSGCVGVGDCIKSCTRDAIRREGNKMVVDRKLCDGCGDCAAENVCPQHLIRMIPASATNFIPCSSTEEDDDRVRETCGFGCIACGECERVCPEKAVHVINNHAVIDYDKCVGCVACTVKCRKKIIVDTQHDLTALKSNVAFVRCSSDGRASVKLKELGVLTCRDAEKVDLKSLGLCTTGCFGLGSCTEVCRYDAIHVENGVSRVDSTKCVGCKACFRTCPQQLISIVPYKGMKLVPCASTEDYRDKAAVCSSGCVFCEDCKNNCPNGAIYAEERHMVVDPDLCDDCKVCTYVCSHNVIRSQEVPDYIYQQREALGIEGIGKED